MAHSPKDVNSYYKLKMTWQTSSSK